VSPIIACGLRKEAAILAARFPGARIVAGGGDGARLGRELDRLAGEGRGIILSGGIAGALDPALACGDAVLDGDAALVAQIRTVWPQAHVGTIAGFDSVVATVAAKAALRTTTGATAVDMETHIARRVAQRHGLPFAAIRVISDSAREALPPAAIVGMRPDGGIAPGAVLRSLARNPAQLPALMRTGRQAGRAFRALARLCDALAGAGIDRLDPGEFGLHG
jgi:adenosylhomocysteine nucleosidase